MTASPLQGLGLDRRQALRCAAGFLAAGSLPLVGCSSHGAGEAGWEASALLPLLSGLVIPATASGALGTPNDTAFMIRAMASGLMGIAPETFDVVSARLRKSAPDFLHLSRDDQMRHLHLLDRATFKDPRPEATPWYALKGLMLICYFTSEAGMTQELLYELAPGHFDADIPVDGLWRPVSNDWSAVSVKKRLHG